MMKALLLAGLLATPLAVAAADVPPAPITDTLGTPATVGQPPAGTGQIVFFRPGAMGMALGCTVHEGGLVSLLTSTMDCHRTSAR